MNGSRIAGAVGGTGARARGAARCRRDGGACHARRRHWDIRETDMKPPRAALSVEPGMNGGVEIEGWDTDSIAVTARIQVNAHSADEADAIARDIKIEASGATIRAIGGGGPVGRHQNWSVVFIAMVPRHPD